jgi:hypothetical protein
VNEVLFQRHGYAACNRYGSARWVTAVGSQVVHSEVPLRQVFDAHRERHCPCMLLISVCEPWSTVWSSPHELGMLSCHVIMPCCHVMLSWSTVWSSPHELGMFGVCCSDSQLAAVLEQGPGSCAALTVLYVEVCLQPRVTAAQHEMTGCCTAVTVTCDGIM